MFLRLADIIPATLKTAVFGLLVGLVACWTGLNADRSAEAVGRAAIRGVVRAILAVFAANVVMVPLIQWAVAVGSRQSGLGAEIVDHVGRSHSATPWCRPPQSDFALHRRLPRRGSNHAAQHRSVACGGQRRGSPWRCWPWRVSGCTRWPAGTGGCSRRSACGRSSTRSAAWRPAIGCGSRGSTPAWSSGWSRRPSRAGRSSWCCGSTSGSGRWSAPTPWPGSSPRGWSGRRSSS